MNGLQTRRTAIALGKQVREAIKGSDVERLEDLLSEVIPLQEYASKMHNHLFYEIEEEVADDETPDSWRFEKANVLLNTLWEQIDERIAEIEEEIDQERIDRESAEIEEWYRSED
jgi:hypothetical protein